MMISKTLMIGVGLVVLALALPQATSKSGKTGKNTCHSKCKIYYKCIDKDLLPTGNGAIQIDPRIGDPDFPAFTGKCKHYLGKCCPQPIPPSPSLPLTSYLTCGNRHTDGVGITLVKGSNSSNYGEFPWQVAVLRRDHVAGQDGQLMECGGSIIKPHVILTAAHCVRRLEKENIYVRAGEWDTQTRDEEHPIQERNVKQVIVHEDYYGGGGFNDVALLVLDKPLEYNQVIGAVCLPRQDETFDNLNCIVTGWGKDVFAHHLGLNRKKPSCSGAKLFNQLPEEIRNTDPQQLKKRLIIWLQDLPFYTLGKLGKYQVIMKKIELPMIPRDTCQATMRNVLMNPEYNLHESILCAGGNPGQDACEGDGGSPLVCTRKGNSEEYIQVGIVSWGVDCGLGNPALYANVPLFRNWIDGKLEKL